MLLREQALRRFLAESPACSTAGDALHALAEAAFLAGWQAAGGNRLLADRILIEDEDLPDTK